MWKTAYGPDLDKCVGKEKRNLHLISHAGVGVRGGARSGAKGALAAIVTDIYYPFCQNPDTKVIDTRISDDGHSIRRRRECPKCGRRFSTVETATLLVRKRSGNVEQFDRNKVVAGVRKACQGRPINEDDLKQLGQKVEESLRAQGIAEVPSEQVGKAILKPLRELDEVAYLRFASVYQNFEDLNDFQRAIDDLREAE